jgi:hypothetical protein
MKSDMELSTCDITQKLLGFRAFLISDFPNHDAQPGQQKDKGKL